MIVSKGVKITVFLSKDYLQTFGKVCQFIRNNQSIGNYKRHYSSNSKNHSDIKDVLENLKLGFIGASRMAQALGRGFSSAGEMVYYYALYFILTYRYRRFIVLFKILIILLIRSLHL